MYLTAEPNDDVRQANDKIDNWEMWKLIPAQKKIRAIKFYVDEEQVLEEKPLMIQEMTSYNECNTRCTSTGVATCPCPGQKVVEEDFVIDHSETRSTSFTVTAGASLTLTQSASIGVEGVFSVGASVEMSAWMEMSTGLTQESTTSWSLVRKCWAESGYKTDCTYAAYETKIDVPFVVYWDNGEVTFGTHKGVDFVRGHVVKESIWTGYQGDPTNKL